MTEKAKLQAKLKRAYNRNNKMKKALESIRARTIWRLSIARSADVAANLEDIDNALDINVYKDIKKLLKK